MRTRADSSWMRSSWPGFYETTASSRSSRPPRPIARRSAIELLLASTDDLLDFLPPDGPSRARDRDPVRLGREARRATDSASCDADRRGQAAGPDPPAAQDPPAGRQLRGPRDRAGRRRRRAGRDLPLRLHEAAVDHADPPRRPGPHPRGLARPHRLRGRAGRRDRPAVPRRRGGRGPGLRGRLHGRQRHHRPQVHAQPRPEAPRARQVLRLAARQVARHVLPGRPLPRSRPTPCPTPRPSRSA